MTAKISAVILTKNEEKNIERCLRSVGFCDEVVIIDDFSEDKTLEKIRNKYKILIFKRKLNDDFAGQRNFGMEKTKGEWILFVDADEEVTRELKIEISRVILNSFQDPNQIPKQVRNDMQAYYLKRRDFWWGRELRHGEIEKLRNRGIIRLVRKGSGKFSGKVHEEFKVKNQTINTKHLTNFINHYPHPTVKDFLEEVNSYSTLRAKELLGNGTKTNIFEIVSYPLGKFLLTYFIKLGFLDGPAGFAYAFFMSFHSFLVRAKLFQFTNVSKPQRHSGER